MGKTIQTIFFSFLKIDFMKAYDKIVWDLIFGVILKMRMPLLFIDRLKLPFHDDGAMVNRNSQPILSSNASLFWMKRLK